LISTGILARYHIRTSTSYEPDFIQWAGQLTGAVLPEETDPGTREFLNSFFPGDRNLFFRNSAGSTLQQLNLLNSPFVTDRVRVSASAVLASLSALNQNGNVLDELFLRFLSRLPSTVERAQGMEILNQATDRAARDAAIEDLAWTCINRMEFILQH
jgi:hypothetical protein